MSIDPHLGPISRAISRIRRAWPTPMSDREVDRLNEVLTLLADDIAALADPSAAARLLSRSRPRVTHTCQVCGASFEAIDRHGTLARYCSGRCKSAAANQRARQRKQMTPRIE